MAALGHPVRLEIVTLLRGGERCVCEIAPHFAQERSVVSRHLAVLEHAGLIRSRRGGQRIFYRLADHRTVRLVETALAIVEHPGRARPVGPRVSKGARKC